MAESSKKRSPKEPFKLFKSKFLRSILLQTIAIFMIVIIIIIATAFFAFTSEINQDIIADRQKQLDAINDDMSQRMLEVTDIAYSIGSDGAFYLEPVDSEKTTGYEISAILGRYLVGNDFIEHLAFYRVAEPDTIYTSNGEMSLSDFMVLRMGLPEAEAKHSIEQIRATTENTIACLTYGDKHESYLSYTYPLPQFSKSPKAFVLMLIPIAEVEPILSSQLANYYGEVAIFDADGDELYRVSNLEPEERGIPIELSADANAYFSHGGKDYVLQSSISSTNGWSYASVIRINDIISETATRQLLFIVILLIIMLAAIFLMLLCIVKQYKPISNLAMSMKDEHDSDGVIDEKSLISDTFTALRDDNAQKNKFEAAYYAADAANKAKSAFFSNMSHDIRTPMNAIIGMTEIALSNTDDPDSVRECLLKVKTSSRYLLDIINNVLDMSRIESGKFTLSEDAVELPRLLHSTLSILNQSTSVKNQRLEVEAYNIRNEAVIGDAVRLSQVFMNILSNSVKFTPDGGTISVRISQSDTTESDEYGENGEYGNYTFVFSDTGIGMSPEFVGKVFDTFTRDASNKVSHIEGTGLGMAIAKNFVELMGGTIKCESELGKGTRFTIALRMKLAPEKLPIQSAAKDKYRLVSVLIIGEESQERLFREQGAKTAYVKTAAEARGSYDYVIINRTYDDKSGIDAVRTLKKNGVSGVFVLVSVDLLSVERSSAFNEGITAFVQAPLFGSDVREILDKGFDKKKLEKDDSIVDLSGKHILLVEDNGINRAIARAQLLKTKAEIVEAEDGSVAVEQFKANAEGYFDVILMDVQMPIMNGYEATAAIRALERPDAATVPIYAMTANTFDEDVRQVREAGMNGHLGKPYESKELYELLRKAIGDK